MLLAMRVTTPVSSEIKDKGQKLEIVKERVLSRKKFMETSRMRIVPDTSVIVDGRITRIVQEEDYKGCEVIVPKQLYLN